MLFPKWDNLQQLPDEVLSRNDVAVSQVRVYIVYLEKLLLKEMQILLCSELNTTHVSGYFSEWII